MWRFWHRPAAYYYRNNSQSVWRDYHLNVPSDDCWISWQLYNGGNLAGSKIFSPNKEPVFSLPIRGNYIFVTSHILRFPVIFYNMPIILILSLWKSVISGVWLIWIITLNLTSARNFVCLYSRLRLRWREMF